MDVWLVAGALAAAQTWLQTSTSAEQAEYLARHGLRRRRDLQDDRPDEHLRFSAPRFWAPFVAIG